MKLYIPTSSLNLGNILSTESISPMSFYPNRNFGTKHWYPVEENERKNIILLYEEPHAFARPQCDLEDHPMLIELDCEDKYPVLQEGVRYSDHTIYLHPWKTHIYFFSDRDKDVALHFCSSSTEVKVLALYLRRIKTQTFSGSFPICESGHDIPQNKQELRRDERINGVKGALYGYYIGAFLSTNSDCLIQLNCYREILNIVSSAISGRGGTLASNQENRLRDIFDTLKRTQPLYQELMETIGGDQLLSVLSILEKHGYPIFTDEFASLSATMRSNPEAAISSVQRKLEQLERVQSSQRNLLSVDKSEVLTTDGQTILISVDACRSELEKKLFESWINECFIPKESLRKISSRKEELTNELVLITQACVGENNWFSSKEYKFMENLKQHIVGAEYKEKWMDDVLSAMAIVVTKGDGWETLLSNMQKRGMSNYRFAFAFYGATLGYSNLTRDFTDLILDVKKNRDYIIELYTEFYGQIHGETILTKGVIETNLIDQSSLSTWDNKTTSNEEKFSPAELNIIERFPKSISELFSDPELDQMEVKHPGSIDFYKNSVIDILNQNSDELEIWREMGAIVGLTGTKRVWGKLLNKYSPTNNKMVLKDFDPVSQGLIPFECDAPTRPFYCDPNAWEYIQGLIPDGSRKQIFDDLSWFQKECQKGYDSEYPFAKSRNDNKKMIEAFCRLKINKKSANKYWPESLRDAIKKKLYSLYLGKE